MTTDELGRAVVETVALAEQTDPDELPEPLCAVVDPDALDRLFRETVGRVEFEYLGYRVMVTHDRTVDVVDLADR